MPGNTRNWKARTKCRFIKRVLSEKGGFGMLWKEFFHKRKSVNPAPKTQKPTKNPVRRAMTEPKTERIVKEERDVPRKRSNANVRSDFLKAFRRLAYRYRAWDVWQDFVLMFACALSNPVDKSHYEKRETRYLKTIKKYRKEEQEIFPELTAYAILALEENPEQDFLGGVFMELDLGEKRKGQFFTPYDVCDVMAKIAFCENAAAKQAEKEGHIAICDSCCGAGATLIAGIHEARRQLEREGLNYQEHVLVVAQDVDETAALMCYIQISLLGVAGYVKVGDSFTDPIAAGDSKENYWFTPMYFSTPWRMRRMFQKVNDITKKVGDEKQ